MPCPFFRGLTEPFCWSPGNTATILDTSWYLQTLHFEDGQNVSNECIQSVLWIRGWGMLCGLVCCFLFKDSDVGAKSAHKPDPCLQLTSTDQPLRVPKLTILEQKVLGTVLVIPKQSGILAGEHSLSFILRSAVRTQTLSPMRLWALVLNLRLQPTN